METGFGRYAKEIIQERALPDVRDGLKPVQRRILYAMYISGFTHNISDCFGTLTIWFVMGKA